MSRTTDRKRPIKKTDMTLKQVKNIMTGETYYTVPAWDKRFIDGVSFTQVVIGYDPNKPVGPLNGRLGLIKSDNLK